MAGGTVVVDGVVGRVEHMDEVVAVVVAAMANPPGVDHTAVGHVGRAALKAVVLHNALGREAGSADDGVVEVVVRDDHPTARERHTVLIGGHGIVEDVVLDHHVRGVKVIEACAERAFDHRVIRPREVRVDDRGALGRAADIDAREQGVGDGEILKDRILDVVELVLNCLFLERQKLFLKYCKHIYLPE